MSDARSLHDFFLASADHHGERPALEVDGEQFSYAALRERATAIAATLQAARAEHGVARAEHGAARTEHGASGDSASSLTAVLVHRSVEGFAGILGALCSGHGYVPMLPSLPPARIALMLARAQTRELVVDREGQAALSPVLALCERPMLVLVLAATPGELAALSAAHPSHTLLGPADMATAADYHRAEVEPDEVAYLLFTSGSTGSPKGVMVAQRNIARFLDVVIERYELRETDRFSHLFEITFDLSVFDLFAAWRVGGCLCVPNMKQRLLPNCYVVNSTISVWFSVPSAALLMKRMRSLLPDSLPGLRLVLFCGEALPVSLVQSFAEAAPNAVIENIYGPTELTLACTHYRWAAESVAVSVAESESEVVPIGDPFEGMRAKIVDADLLEVAPGETGELIMAGPQCALGYRGDPERTAAAFLVPPGETEIFYRTGDRVRRPAQPGVPMTFLGRLDSQIKINGYRVELGEIEAVLRREAGVDAAVAVGWPKTPGGAAGVIGFMVAEPGSLGVADIDALLERMAVSLPRYMVPKDIVLLSDFPLNANGKIDRKALAASLDDG